MPCCGVWFAARHEKPAESPRCLTVASAHLGRVPRIRKLYAQRPQNRIRGLRRLWLQRRRTAPSRWACAALCWRAQAADRRGAMNVAVLANGYDGGAEGGSRSGVPRSASFGDPFAGVKRFTMPWLDRIFAILRSAAHRHIVWSDMPMKANRSTPAGHPAHHAGPMTSVRVLKQIYLRGRGNRGACSQAHWRGNAGAPRECKNERATSRPQKS
jgi:hypothetical protein